MDPRVVYKFGSVSGLWIKPKLPAAQILANLFGPPWEGTNCNSLLGPFAQSSLTL